MRRPRTLASTEGSAAGGCEVRPAGGQCRYMASPQTLKLQETHTPYRSIAIARRHTVESEQMLQPCIRWLAGLARSHCIALDRACRQRWQTLCLVPRRVESPGQQHAECTCTRADLGLVSQADDRIAKGFAPRRPWQGQVQPFFARLPFYTIHEALPRIFEPDGWSASTAAPLCTIIGEDNTAQQ